RSLSLTAARPAIYTLSLHAALPICRRRLVRHARITIGGASGNTLEQRQHGTHLRLVIQCRDKMHLTGTGIGKAHVNAGIDQRFHQGLGAITHDVLRNKFVLLFRRSYTPLTKDRTAERAVMMQPGKKVPSSERLPLAPPPPKPAASPTQ